ncbi:uncharacterized protein BXZ73DRAFT_104430 [Epithele typhae]|uniref:uncharacterized protein n=1 Tax=Epithele typhae TaxID=378194 RepID=UPI002008D8FB|nr:uncharacterized protein BXZ73DRAFT_104430 [Epithele typhae]KAH9921548.1 hypothetical protein BXZ73DRAFT_104430 [Epithele typhae]
MLGSVLNPSDQWKHVFDILTHLRPLLLVEDIVDSPTANTPPQLRRLQEEYRQIDTSRMSANLAQFSYYLEDRAAVTAVIADERVELHVMSLFHLLVKNLHSTLQGLLQHQNLRSDELATIEHQAISCMVVYLAFEKRIHDLMRNWRLQGRDIDLQLGRFADGVFQDVQRKTASRQKSLEKLCAALFGSREPPARYRSLVESASHTPHTPLNDLTGTVNQLNQQVQTLTESVAQLIATMQKPSGVQA